MKKDYYFTFGFGQGHDNCYVVIHGTYQSARERMFEVWGSKWAMQYDSADDAGVDEFNLRKIQ